MIAFFQESIPPVLQNYLGKPDDRVKEWILLNSPVCLVTVFVLYFSTLTCGNMIMKNRKPFNLKNVLIAYNSFQIGFSAYICKEVVVTAFLSGHNLVCVQLDRTKSELALRMVRAFWFFYISKMIDMMDTVFFVLSKKISHLTFLHVYHHASMVLNWYLVTLYIPGGQAFFTVVLNAFVHTIMYTYYLLSAMGPKMQKYLWWKKYLTQLQLIQFFLVMFHIGIGYLNGCKEPSWLACYIVIYLCVLVVLFLHFYTQAYKSKVTTSRHGKTLGIFTMPHGKQAVSYIDIKAGGDMKDD